MNFFDGFGTRLWLFIRNFFHMQFSLVNNKNLLQLKLELV